MRSDDNDDNEDNDDKESFAAGAVASSRGAFSIFFEKSNCEHGNKRGAITCDSAGSDVAVATFHCREPLGVTSGVSIK